MRAHRAGDRFGVVAEIEMRVDGTRGIHGGSFRRVEEHAQTSLPTVSYLKTLSTPIKVLKNIVLFQVEIVGEAFDTFFNKGVIHEFSVVFDKRDGFFARRFH